MPVEILLNPDSAEHAELEKGIRDILNGLESVKYSEQTRPTPAGTLLPGWEQVTSFVVRHPNVVVLTSGLLSAISNFFRWASTKNKKTVVVVVNGQSIDLPASEAVQKKFIDNLKPKTKSIDAAKKNSPATRKVSARKGKKSLRVDKSDTRRLVDWQFGGVR